MSPTETPVEHALRALQALGALPAAPYFEHAGARYVAAECEAAGLGVTQDRFGNVLACRPGSDRTAPGMAFVAHLDHPGFEAVRRASDGLVARALGGVPPKALEGGAAVLAVTADGRRVAGSISGPAEFGEERHVVIKIDPKEVGELPCAVVFDLPDFSLDGGSIRMRALDDLAGCAAALAAVVGSAARESPGSVYALFTRAEEVGLIGARLAAGETLLPKDTIVVSVESSRTLPGAEIGGGPVVRVGDAHSTFDRSAEAYLLAARARLHQMDDEFACQRQLMSGGTCEASAFGAYGYAVTGMAFPLGNYHNAAPDGGVAAEHVDQRDFERGVALLVEAASLAGTTPAGVAGTTGRSGAWLADAPNREAARLEASAHKGTTGG